MTIQDLLNTALGIAVAEGNQIEIKRIKALIVQRGVRGKISGIKSSTEENKDGSGPATYSRKKNYQASVVTSGSTIPVPLPVVGDPAGTLPPNPDDEIEEITGDFIDDENTEVTEEDLEKIIELEQIRQVLQSQSGLTDAQRIKKYGDINGVKKHIENVFGVQVNKNFTPAQIHNFYQTMVDNFLDENAEKIIALGGQIVD